MILKCKMCGGDIELSQDRTFGTCDSCGSIMTFPRVDDEQRAAMFNRGNHFRRTGEFDKALAVYERIVQEDESDAEAHWCCALCRFGIEYVEDPNTFEYLPTCHRASFDSFLEDVDYLAALEHSDGITRRQYQKDAQKIAEVQRGILATSQNEEPFDVFICYKESEDDGSRTRDSLYAQDIYYQLTEQGRRVFFSRITLEDKAGTEYEPYIFAALNSAKVMILVTTSAEHANAVWVKNEWSRFLSLMRKDRTKLLLPCYRDMDPYDLPEAISVLQSYDMSKIGFIQDLIRGVNKVLNASKPRETLKETVMVQQTAPAAANTAPLLERAFMFLEDGDWAKADDFCEQVLNLDARNALAYLGKLMAEVHARKRETLRDCAEPFDDCNSYQKALRFGDDKLKAELSSAITFINDRNETARKEGIYQKALQWMKDQRFTDAKGLFDSISGYRDSVEQSRVCIDKAEVARKNNLYAQASVLMCKGATDEDYVKAAQLFKTIPGWKDADDQILVCQRRIEEIKAKEELDRQEAARKVEEARIAKEKASKKRKRTIAIVASIIVACIVFVIVLTSVIIPNHKYAAAVELYTAGKYEEAIAAFAALNGYKDSAAQIEKCETAIKDEKYAVAADLYTAGKYEEAIAAFTALDGYKDSAAKTDEIKAKQYDAAVELYTAGKYEEAIAAFIALDGYKDSNLQIDQCCIKKYGKEKYDYIKSINIGDTFIFGKYEQDNITTNGKEGIEWIVLDRKGVSLLLISKYALDCQQYNTTYTNATWETCSLRKWLNDTFLNAAFSSSEQNSIINSTVTADNNPSHSTPPGNNTTDKVFLLSIAEANKYFKSDEERKCSPTDFALAQGAWVWKPSENITYWWLRSPGESAESAAGVGAGGGVHNDGHVVIDSIFSVRPTIWIDLGSFDLKSNQEAKSANP